MKPGEDKKGFTLVEVIVAAAILAILSVMIVSGFLAVGNVSMKASDNKASDAGLESAIAAEGSLDGYTKTDIAASPLSFTAGGETFELPLEADRYTSESTQNGFTVFELGSSVP